MTSIKTVFDNVVFVGIDVSKDTLDVHCRPIRRERQFRNNASGVAQLIEWIRPLRVERVVLEATGGYERVALWELYLAEFTVFLVQPNSARHFAKSQRQYAKTDRLDAMVLAHFAESLNGDRDHPWTPPSESQRALRQLVQRRRQLMEILDMEKKRRRAAGESVASDTFEPILDIMGAQLKDVERRIDEMMEKDEELASRSAVLEAVAGVGRITAAVLLSELPELGTVSRGEITALVGIAPHTRQSGSWVGHSFIYGGRASVRSTMYMAALASTRHNKVIKDYYSQLVGRGKPPKVALIACARKLLVHLNGLLSHHLRTLQAEAAAI